MDRPIPHVRPRLAAMMFLYFFSIGSWAVTLSTYLMSAPTRGGLAFSTTEVGWVYSTFAFGGMIAPVFVGLLADRLFRAERVLGVCGLLCAVCLFAAGRWCESRFPATDAAYRAALAADTPAGRIDDDPTLRRTAAETFRPVFALMLVYCTAMQIGLTLTTVIAFRNLPDAHRAFSRVRLVGTLGWIAAGYTLGQLLAPVSADCLDLASGSSALLGVYAFTLPATPPRSAGGSLAAVFGLPALRLFRDRSFGVFVAVAFATTAMNQFYAVFTHRLLTDHGVPRPELVMTLGQVVEAGCMFLIPLLDPRRWLKLLMTLGLAGWVARAGAMVSGTDWLIVGLAVPMHGWSYAFFAIVAATYLDREAPPQLRASAQGILTFVQGGLGVWVGNLVAGRVVDAHRDGPAIDWPTVWQIPLVVCTAALVVFALFFRPPPERGR
jgi:nucleoside transporter